MSTIMRKMNIISRSEGVYRTEQSHDNLSGVYHSYVLAICKNPGLSQEKLAQHLCMNKSSVTRHIGYLEREGYIKREICPKDKREQLVYPTEKMLSIHSEVLSITKKWNSLISEGISSEELEIFHSILDKMVDKSRDIIYGDDEQ